MTVNGKNSNYFCANIIVSQLLFLRIFIGYYFPVLWLLLCWEVRHWLAFCSCPGNLSLFLRLILRFFILFVFLQFYLIWIFFDLSFLGFIGFLKPVGWVIFLIKSRKFSVLLSSPETMLKWILYPFTYSLCSLFPFLYFPSFYHSVVHFV